MRSRGHRRRCSIPCGALSILLLAEGAAAAQDQKPEADTRYEKVVTIKADVENTAGLSLTPDGKKVAVVGRAIRVFDTSTGTELAAT